MSFYLFFFFFFFFFNDTATTEIYTLSLHDALPTCAAGAACVCYTAIPTRKRATTAIRSRRSEEHTSELQSQFHLVCSLLLETKNEGDVQDPVKHDAGVGVGGHRIAHKGYFSAPAVLVGVSQEGRATTE